MDTERWARVTVLFDRARDVPAAERPAWLRGECQDETLITEVLAMLTAYDSDPDFLEAPVDAGLAVPIVQDYVRRSLEGRRLGAYRLVREIGRGGMGVVCEAVRDDEAFDRRVAIKLLPSGWLTPALAERFRLERRVLAELDHPGIARLLDAGATDDGVPYFVMELVDGQPIDAWSRDHRLDTKARVDLVHRVCAAVTHAHQHLVVHRDLKPANILVTSDGEPKLLDFGIATLVSEAGSANPGLTRTGEHGFTTEYASPEQIRGERVTTATDVFSLGVLLYVLLTQRPPYEVRGLPPMEAMRVTCEVDPEAPSRVAPTAHELRGDLDNIVLKALRKEPRERYGSVADLAADLSAWLERRPVSASPATIGYRARRFVTRHALAVAAGSVTVLAVISGTAATAWQAHVAQIERDKAERRFAQVREFSRSLLFDVHDALRPLPGATEPRRMLLDRAVQFLDGLAADAGDDVALTLELAEGYRRLGTVQGSAVSDNLGDVAGARRSFEAATRLADAALAGAPRSSEAIGAVADAHAGLARILMQAGATGQADLAHARHREAVERLERESTADPALAASVAAGYLELGYFRGGRGDAAGAKTLYEKAVLLHEGLPQAQRRRDEVARSHAFALKRLAAILVSEGQLTEGERRYREALALDEQVVSHNPGNAPYLYDLTFSLADLGFVARKRGDLAAAEAMYLRALQVRGDALAADPKNTRVMFGVVSVHGSLAVVQAGQRRYAEAVAHQRAALDLLDQLRAVLGSTTRIRADQAWGHLRLATLLLDLGEANGSRQAASITEARQHVGTADALARGLHTALTLELTKQLDAQRARLQNLAR